MKKRLYRSEDGVWVLATDWSDSGCEHRVAVDSLVQMALDGKDVELSAAHARIEELEKIADVARCMLHYGVTTMNADGGRYALRLQELINNLEPADA